MQAFDLVDTLVEINYSVRSRRQLIDNILNAKVIYRPRGQFRIFTAQQDNSEIHDAISRMVSINFPNCIRVHFVSGGEAQVAEAKARLIKQHAITEFTDNNRGILAKIKELVSGVTLWVMTENGKKRY